MPHSLRVRLKNLQRKGELTEKDIDRIFKALEQEPCDDAVSRQAVLASIKNLYPDMPIVDIFGARRKWLDKYAPYFECENAVEQLPPVRPQEQTGHYEKHIDHTDCIWYGSDSGCPVTCSQYRDGWNDAMDYIFKNGKGYQPYRHDG